VGEKKGGREGRKVGEIKKMWVIKKEENE